MANYIKLTQMSVASTLNATDYLMIVQGGVNKKTTVTNILKNLNSGDSVRVNPIQNAVDFSVASKNDANMLIVKGAYDRLGIGTDTPAEKVHVVGNVQIGSSTSDGVLVQSTETVTYSAADESNAAVKPISPMRAVTMLNCGTGVNGLFSLTNGFNGEIKTIFQNELTSGNNSQISLNGVTFDTITFSNTGTSSILGASTMLQYITAISKWIIVGGSGAVYSQQA